MKCKTCEGSKWVELSMSDVACWDCRFTGRELGFRVYKAHALPKPYTYSTNRDAYCSPAWAAGDFQRGGRNHYVLVEAGYGDLERGRCFRTDYGEAVRLVCIDARGEVRWDVFPHSLRYALEVEKETGAPPTDHTKGDFVEHYWACKHFGLRLA